MGINFSNFSLATRAWSIFAICLIGIIANAVTEVADIRKHIRQAHANEIEHLVEASLGILRYYERRASRGELPLKEAQQQALAVLSSMRYQQSNYIFVANDDGYSISNGNAQLIGTDIRNMRDANGKLFVQELYTVAKAGGGFVNYLFPNPKANGEQQPKTSYARYFPAWGWTVGTGINIREMESQISAAQQRALLIAAVIILLVSILIAIFIRGLTRPIARTIEAMQNLTQGDMDLEQRLPEKGCRELADLAREFNQFVFSLRTLVNQVNLAGHRLNSALTQLHEIGKDMEPDRSTPEKQLQLNRGIEHMLSTVSKISERTRQMQSSHELMRMLAEQDPLTGLLNRRAFLEKVEAQLAGLDEGEPHCLLLADVDHFKAINDTFGHDTGDQALLELSVILQEHFGRHALVSRYGGEEFVIWLPSMYEALASDICEQLLARLRHYELLTDRGAVSFTLSIGLTCTRGSVTLKNLLRKADEALYRAKSNGRDQYQVWHDAELLEENF
ncbi:diguanylate cyclase [Marinobacterium jannaschii]|uniref:diguanylate cyclase n=1 Tax=Marinobacterium jannaschii TaxID=64970 RepID=UPI000481476E|nr:diguanylate cyclase [Marinobacterium jannaschii]